MGRTYYLLVHALPDQSQAPQRCWFFAGRSLHVSAWYPSFTLTSLYSYLQIGSNLPDHHSHHYHAVVYRYD